MTRVRLSPAHVALALALVALGLLASVSVAVYRGQRDLAARVADTAAAHEALFRAVGESRARADAYRGELVGVAAALRQREARQEGLTRRLRVLEQEASAGERIIRAYGAGVALIQATVRYEDASGKPLRYLRADPKGRPQREALGPPPVSLDGEGPIVTTTVLGSGFLVSRDGLVLTSRHIGQPWDEDEALAAVREEGLEPRLVQFRAFFPDLPAAVALTALQASDGADVMTLRAALPAGSIPILPLDRTPTLAVPGRPVVVLGYPAGLELLLAQVEPAVLRMFVDEETTEIADDTVDVPALLAELARRRLIRPYVTWGHLVDVRPHLIAYDAETSFGGSGGPILSTSGRVIGVNYAMLRGFEGLRLGVPIRFGLSLLR